MAAGSSSSGRPDDLVVRARAAVPGCRLAVWADLGSELPLAVSAANRPPQEALNALAASVAQLLPPPGSSPVAGLPFEGLPARAVLGRTDGTLVALRLPGDPAEALCCLCDASSDPFGALAQLCRVLDR